MFDEQARVFTISPIKIEEIKTHLIKVDLIDQFDAKTSYTFKIVITDISIFNISK